MGVISTDPMDFFGTEKFRDELMKELAAKKKTVTKEQENSILNRRVPLQACQVMSRIIKKG